MRKNLILTTATILAFLMIVTVYPGLVFAQGEDVRLPSQEEVQRWSQEILEKANNAPVLGDFKLKREGIYQSRSAFGEWSWRDGVICITDSYASFPFFNNGHAGIMAAAPYYYSTIEANPGAGVQVVKGSWVTRFTGQVYQYGVLATTIAQDQAAAIWAATQIGKPYKFPNTLGNRSSYYCSHLVYAAYLDTAGVNLDTWAYFRGVIHPYEFMNESNCGLIYRKQ